MSGQHKCYICSDFVTDLKGHLSEDHPEAYVCKICTHHTPDYTAMTLHIQRKHKADFGLVAPTLELVVTKQEPDLKNLAEWAGLRISTGTISRTGHLIHVNVNEHRTEWGLHFLTPNTLKNVPKRKISRSYLSDDPDLTKLNVLQPRHLLYGDAKFGSMHRGHLVAAGNFAGNLIAHRESCFPSNLLPMNSDLNCGAWKGTEDLEKSLAQMYELVVVISGAIYGASAQKYYVSGGIITVPSEYFKIIYCSRSGEDPVIQAYLFPNLIPCGRTHFISYMSTVERINNETGLRVLEGHPNYLYTWNLNKKAWICEECFATFADAKLYEDHLKTHDLCCRFCGKQMSTEQNRKVHEEDHEYPGINFSCHLCNVETKSKRGLRSHLETDHGLNQGEAKLKADIAATDRDEKRRFAVPISPSLYLQNQSQSLTGKSKPKRGQDWVCEVCGATIRGKGADLMRHKEVKHGIPYNYTKGPLKTYSGTKGNSKGQTTLLNFLLPSKTGVQNSETTTDPHQREANNLGNGPVTKSPGSPIEKSETHSSNPNEIETLSIPSGLTQMTSTLLQLADGKGKRKTQSEWTSSGSAECVAGPSKRVKAEYPKGRKMISSDSESD